jgi:hypothetical protein
MMKSEVDLNNQPIADIPQCAHCVDPADLQCDICNEDVCPQCMDDHVEQFHGFGGEEL